MIAHAARRAPVLSLEELAIARSVLYASLFDYPLTLEQLHEGLIESRQTPSEILRTVQSSEALRVVVHYQDGYFFPAGCARWIATRKEREARSRAFLEKHRRLLALICAIPYTRLVALSGSLAHMNLEPDGDLDLFIVAAEGHVWSVTLAVIVIARLLRQRRTVCANFVMADSRLDLEQPDLFTANQVIHLRPLAGEPTFRSLLAANPFVTRFYPNYRGPAPLEEPGRTTRIKTIVEAVCAVPARWVERLCRRVYESHLQRRAASWRSPDQVRLGPDCLKLHTRSHRQSILERFDRAMQDALERVEER